MSTGGKILPHMEGKKFMTLCPEREAAALPKM
jgi:hypothetical protein